MPDSLHHIVLVDDNETTSFLNNRLLARLGAAERVSTISRADEAFAQIWGEAEGEGKEEGNGKGGAAPAPDLLFVDLKMPGVSGFDFLKLYAALPAPVQERTVVAVLTTSLHAADTARVAAHPNVEYLTKPLTEEKMAMLLARRFAGRMAA